MLEDQDNNAAALLAAGQRLGEVRKNPHAGGRDFVIINKAGSDTVEYLERPGLPERMKGTVATSDTPSFILAVNRHASKDGTVIYGTLKPAVTFLAVLNDHSIGARGALNHDGANWRDHRVSYTPTKSDELTVWEAGNTAGWRSQEEFAFFIEKNLPDFKNPAGARMLEMAIKFKVNRAMNFKSAINLASGEVDLEYSDVNQGGGTGPTKHLALPEKFTIEIPVWAGIGQKKYPIEAHLRYRVNDGALTMKYELIRVHKVMEAAFEDMLADIKKGVKDVPFVFGAPGA